MEKSKQDLEKMLLLSPRISNDKVTMHYVSELESLIQNKSAYNIALAGAYGSGKSSVIQTFLSMHEKNKEKYIVISIGSFLTIPNHSKKTDSDQQIDESEYSLVTKIENSILKQLIYRNTAESMPNSRMRRLKKSKILWEALYTYLVLFPLISYILENFDNPLEEIFQKIPKWFYTALFSFYLIGLVITIWNLISKIITKGNLIEVKSSKYEIKLNGEENLPFNKELYEIVYFFQRNKPIAIFFEDIDRFPQDVIMKVVEELKELNNIVNIVSKQKVTFIYSFRDNIFHTSEERSKFYDYISSVMPISTSYNSLLQLYSFLEEKQIPKEEIANELITIVTKYITDMRTLISIVNDYVSFKEILNTSEYDKLFAMCAFKNVYITDYTNILSPTNEIEQTFSAIRETRKQEIDKLHENILKEEKELYQAKEYRQMNISTCKKAFINENMKRFRPNKIIIDKNSFSIEQFYSNDFDLDILKNSSVQLSSEYDGTWEINRDKVQNFLENIERLQSRNLEENIEALNRRIEELMKSNLQELAEIYLRTHEKDLLKELICHGYIEEDYIDFITSPTVNHLLKPEDNKYMMDVQHDILSFDTPVLNPKEVIFYLSSYFKKKSILNFDMITYIINNIQIEENRTYLEKIIDQFQKIDEDKANFLYSYYGHSHEEYDRFLTYLSRKEICVFEEIVFANLPHAYIYTDFILESTLRNKEALKKLMSIEKFYEYLNARIQNQSLRYNALLEEESVRRGLKQISYPLEDITVLNESNREFIYQNRLYRLNEKNIQCYSDGLFMQVPWKKLSKIEKYEPLVTYIKENFMSFDIHYYSHHNYQLNDSRLIKELLNNMYLTKMTKEGICKRENFTISLTRVDPLLYPMLLEYHHIKPNFTNLYMLKDKVKKEKLIAFIMQNPAVFLRDSEIHKLDKLGKEYIIGIGKKLQEEKLLWDKWMLLKKSTIYQEDISNLERKMNIDKKEEKKKEKILQKT